MNRVLDLIHEGAHVKDPSTSRVKQIIRVRGVRQLRRVEPLPIISDVYRYRILFGDKSNIHLLVGSAFVAVHYGVDDRLVHRKLDPARVRGSVKLPGDKSISHRIAMLASIANGPSAVTGFASSADCQATLDCIRKLGIRVEDTGSGLVIHGEGLFGYRPPEFPESPKA